MNINDGNRIQQVKDQFERTDFSYKLNVENLSIDKVLEQNNNVRLGILQIWGTIMETYLKGILLWKGSEWSELKSKGHSLKRLYEALDEVGKNLFFQHMKLKNERANMIDADNRKNIQSNDNIKAFLHWQNIQKSSSYSPKGYENGKWDGEAELDQLFSKKRYSIDAICNMLNMIKVSEFRYADAQGIFNDDFMRTMYDAVRSIHALTIIARGEKKQSI